jgi:MraZ protein
MGSFKGSETFTLDLKGRVNIPAKMKKCIPIESESTFVVTRGVDKCIAAYPKNIWENKYQLQLENLNQFNRDHTKLLRMMLQYCEDITLDSIQRLMLPKELIEFAGIEGNVTIIGMHDHIELWNPDTYKHYLESFDESYEEIAEKVMTGNIDNAIKN